MIKEEAVKKLADIIEQNPDCKFSIDNDNWCIISNDNETILADSYDFEYRTDWYSHSTNYGAGLSEALIEILKRRGFNITASAV